jgi:mannose-6-phosphate isomerase-like protein (cupin superfamily)
MRIVARVFIAALSLSVSISARQQPGSEAAARPPANENVATRLAAGDIGAWLAKMTGDRPTQEHTIVERVGAYRLSIEHRTLPQRPAVHEQEAELWAVVEGTAIVTTGGTIVGAAAPSAGTATQAPGNVFGKTIAGGTPMSVGPGDFLLIPEGVPHQITDASPTLKFVVFEVTRPKTARKAY